MLKRLIEKSLDLKCLGCKQGLGLNDFKEDQTAHCKHCGKVTDYKAIAAAININRTAIDKGTALHTPAIRVHKGLNGKAIIDRKWLVPRTAIAHLVIALIMCFTLSELLTMLFRGHPITFVGVVFIILAIFYRLFQNLLNTTRFQLDPKFISVQVTPLSFKKIILYKVDEISNFSIERNVVKSADSTNYQHRVMMVQKNGDMCQLTTVANMAEAILIERTLEQHYNITDDPTLDKIAR